MAAESFFTIDSFGTVAGSAAAIIVLTNTCRKITRWITPLVPFVFSLIVAFLAAGAFAGKLENATDWIIAFLNSCLLFCTATGAQEVVVSGANAQDAERASRQSSNPVPFFSSWLWRG